MRSSPNRALQKKRDRNCAQEERIGAVYGTATSVMDRPPCAAF